MTRLFIELYVDEDVSVLVAELVRARNYDVLTARDAGNLTASDEQQLAFAVQQQRTILTHNRGDFELLHQKYMTTGQHHYGIIIAIRRPVYVIARRLLSILNQVTADEMEDQLCFV